METNPTPPPSRSKSLFTWRTARRLLVSAAVLATLVAVFYSVENWRGRRAWEKCRRELEAQGRVVDWNALIPPPVPDDQNIYKAPRMTEWFVGRGTNDLSERLANPITSSIGLTNAIQTEADARAYLAWSDPFEPEFEVIRDAVKRPYARIDCNYARPSTLEIPNFKTARIVAQTWAQRAHACFLIGNPDGALRELTRINDLCRIFEGAPTGKPMTLVAAMINVAVTGLYVETIAEGFHRNAWREPQIRALEPQLDKIYLVPFVVEALHNEQAACVADIERLPRAELVRLFQDFANQSYPRMLLVLKYAPQGWLYQNMVTRAQPMGQFPDGMDLASRTVSPQKVDETARLVREINNDVRPYTFLSFWLTPNFGRAIQRTARNQTAVHQATIVCALERYRLVHGEYPETLNALAPEFIAKLPHDMIGGQPLRYRRVAGGKFTLYSVGWNEKDDAGIASPKQDGNEDLENGDWVWPQASL